MDLPPTATDDPLAQPTAIRLFEALTEARHPLTTEEAAERAGVHPNSARLHLGRLAAAGLVEDGLRPRRPRPAAQDLEGRERRPHRRPPARRVPRARAVARPLGRRDGGRPGRDPRPGPEDRPRDRRRVGERRRSGGPRRLAAGDGLLAAPRAERATTTCFTLCNCPYRDVAESNIEVICTLHLGIAEGIVAGRRSPARASPTSKRRTRRRPAAGSRSTAPTERKRGTTMTDASGTSRRERPRAHAGDDLVHGLLLRLGPARAARARPPGAARPDRRPARPDDLDPGRARLADADPARRPDRPLRRPPGLHAADGLHAAAADRPRPVQRLLGGGPRLRLPARLRRRLVRGRRAVRQQVVPAEPAGLRARHLRDRHGRHRRSAR